MKRYWLYIILFVVAECLISFSMYSYKEQRISEYIDSYTEHNTTNLQSMQSTYKNMYSDVFKTVLDKPIVKEYMHNAYTDISARGAVRNSLYSYILPVFHAMRSTNLENVHFHFPDLTSFLRMKDLNAYGDDLTKERSLVLKTNEKNEFSEGFEKGLHSTGYRYVFPLNSETEHLGSVEFVIDIDGFVNALNTLYGSNFKFVFTEKELSGNHSKKREPYKVADDFYADSCLGCELTDDYGLMSEDVNRILSRDFGSEVRDRLTSASTSSYMSEYNGRKYIITFTPIREIKGEYLGAIVRYEKAYFYDKIIGYTLMMYALLSFIAAAIVTAIAILDNARRKSINENHELELIIAEKVKELRDKEQFFAQQAKMATMGEMLAAILHQWKQPISSISLLADMLLFDCNTNGCNEETKKFLQEIKSQTMFMTQTDRDFRNFLKPSSKPEAFNVCDAVIEVIRLFDFSFARYNTSFQTYWTQEIAEIAYIKGYPNEFKHVILNLFNNARDAIADKREQMIENNQDVSMFKGVIKISITADKGSLVIKVSDTGGGIPDAVITKIFDQYFSTKNENGTGIGLYMTRNLVETNMHGRIYARNIDEGAEFTIECPITDKE